MSLLLQRGFRPLVKHHHRLFSTINQSLTAAAPCTDDVINKLRESTPTSDSISSVLEDMQSKGWKADSNAFKSILHGLDAHDQGHQIEQVYEYMRDKGVVPAGLHINTLKIEGLCRIGETEKAKDLFQKEWKMMKPIRTYIYYRLISGYSSEGKVEQGKLLLCEMCEKGVQPDILCYQGLIAFLCHEKDSGMAVEVYKHAISKDILIQNVTCDILTGSLMDDGNLEQVKRLYRFMARKRVELDEYSFQKIFNYFCCNRDTKMALRMLKHRYKVTKRCVDDHLLRLCEILKFEEMVELIDYMEKKAYSVKIYTYIYWIRNLCEKNNIEEAELVYETMRGRIPEPSTYQLLIRQLRGNVNVLRKIYQDICENDIQADEYIYKDLVDALLQCEDYETVFRLAYDCLKNRHFSHVFLSDASTMKTLNNGLAIISKNGVVKKDLKLIAEKGHERLLSLWSTIKIYEAIAMINMLSSCDLQPNSPTVQQVMTIVSRDWLI